MRLILLGAMSVVSADSGVYRAQLNRGTQRQARLRPSAEEPAKESNLVEFPDSTGLVVDALNCKVTVHGLTISGWKNGIVLSSELCVDLSAIIPPASKIDRVRLDSPIPVCDSPQHESVLVKCHLATNLSWRTVQVDYSVPTNKANFNPRLFKDGRMWGFRRIKNNTKFVTDKARAHICAVLAFRLDNVYSILAKHGVTASPTGVSLLKDKSPTNDLCDRTNLAEDSFAPLIVPE